MTGTDELQGVCSTLRVDASEILVEVKRMVAAEVHARLADPETLSELSAILEAMVTDYLERHPPAAVNPRPDSMELGSAGERLKVYFNAQDKEEADGIVENAIAIREEGVSSSYAAIFKRDPEMQPKPKAARKGAGNGD